MSTKKHSLNELVSGLLHLADEREDEMAANSLQEAEQDAKLEKVSESSAVASTESNEETAPQVELDDVARIHEEHDGSEREEDTSSSFDEILDDEEDNDILDDQSPDDTNEEASEAIAQEDLDLLVDEDDDDCASSSDDKDNQGTSDNDDIEPNGEHGITETLETIVDNDDDDDNADGIAEEKELLNDIFADHEDLPAEVEEIIQERVTNEDESDGENATSTVSDTKKASAENRPPINVVIDDSELLPDEPIDVADAMLMDIDDIADSDEEKEALRGDFGNVALSVGEIVSDKKDAAFYTEQLERRTVSSLYDEGDADRAKNAAVLRPDKPEASSIGDSDLIGKQNNMEYAKRDLTSHSPSKPRRTPGAKRASAISARTMPIMAKSGFPKAQTIGKVANIPAIYDALGQEIKLGDRMAYGTCYDYLGEVVGIGHNCFFTVHLEEKSDGTQTYVADQWILDGDEEDGGNYYHYVEDNLTFIIDDITDESISIEELAGRFREVTKIMRSKKGISHQQYLRELQKGNKKNKTS